MPLTKIKRGGLDTGITDNSDANALTFDSSENANFSGDVYVNGNSSDYDQLTIEGAAASGIRFKDSGGTTDGFVYASSDNIGFLKSNGGWLVQSNATSTSITGNLTASGVITTGAQHDALIVNAPANGNAQIKFQDNGTDKWKIGKQGSAMGFALYNPGTDSNALSFNVSNNDATFAAQGTFNDNLNVVKSASATITIKGNAANANASLTFMEQTTTMWEIRGDGGASDKLSFIDTGGAEVLALAQDSNATFGGWVYVNNRVMGASGDIRVGSNDGNEMLHLLADGTAKIDTAGTTALTISSSQNATFAGAITNTGLHTINQTADDDGIKLTGYDDVNNRHGWIGITSIGYTQIFAQGDRSIDLKSGRQIRFFTSTDNSTYNNSFNLNSNGSVLSSASISGDFSSKVYNSSSSGWGLQVQAGDGSGQYVFHCKDYDDANPLFWVKGNGLVYTKQGMGIRGSTPSDSFAIVSTGPMSFGSCEEVTIAGSRSGTDHTAENTAVQIELRNTHSNDNSAGAIVGLDKDGLELTKIVFKNDDHNADKGSIDFHTSNGSGDMRTRRLRIDNGGDSYFYGAVSVDVGAPSSADKEIARFKAHSDRPIAVGWIDSGSKMSLYTPSGHHLVLGAGALGTRNIEIDDNGDIYFLGATSAPWDMTSGSGGLWQTGGVFATAMSGGAGSSCFMANKTGAEGHMMDFAYDRSIKGYINLSGETVSLVGFSGQHESETSDKAKSIPKGTVMSSIGTTFKADHVKTKISDSVGDVSVYGVVSSYASYDTGADKDVDYRMILNAVGIAEVLVTGKASIGDLIESNGDGSAKVQDDDIIRSKTIGKVTKAKTTTSKGLALCVLYCG